jgi:hypothetical protein
MRNIYASLALMYCCGCPMAADIYINDAEEITEEFLTSTGSSCHYTEHVAHIKRIFNNLHVRTFLEFGVGFSTKFFIDQSDHVISVEFITPGTGPEWMQFCESLSQLWQLDAYSLFFWS